MLTGNSIEAVGISQSQIQQQCRESRPIMSIASHLTLIYVQLIPWDDAR